MTFYGYRRPDGRVGVRNKVLILPTSVCASDTARIISRFYGDSNVIFCINNHCICHFVIFLLSRSCSAGDVWVYVEERRSSILRSRAAVSGDCAALSGRMTAGKLLHAMM